MKSRFFLPAILGIIIILSLGNCNKEEVTKFLIDVDSIAMADTVSLPDPLEVELFGTIGPNGCYEFSNLEFEQEDTVIIMEVWGKKTEGKDVVCTDAVVLLDGSVVNITFQDAGNYIIKVKKPDNKELTDTVTVLPS